MIIAGVETPKQKNLEITESGTDGIKLTIDYFDDEVKYIIVDKKELLRALKKKINNDN